jgi:hypothetical protein
MSDVTTPSDVTSPPETAKATPPKKGVSAARNAVGLVVLIAVAILGYIEYTAKSAFNAAVTGLSARTEDENKGLLTPQEAETIMGGKAPDGPGMDIHDTLRDFTRTTYSWRGIFKPYTITAFYTKGANPYLHHFETEGAKPAPLPESGFNPTTSATPIPASAPK